MKLIQFLAAVTFVVLCALFSSCEKEESSCENEENASAYHFATWYGTYPSKMLNNDTKEMEDCTSCIFLQFCHSGIECIVDKGIVGLLGINRSIYDVKWFSKEKFTLCKTQSGQTIQYYSGTINGSKMSFEFLSCDKIERTIELEKIIYE